MPFVIERNDLTRMRCDAIVNTANPKAVVGRGSDAAIHAAAGPRLLEARRAVGQIAVGTAAITPAFDLDARFVIHTVGPVWRGGGFGEEQLLRSCYDSALALAVEHGCRSIAFPLISSGNYGFPKDKALTVAIAAFSDFLLRHELQIVLTVWGGDTLRLSERLFAGVESYIDENYVQEKSREYYGGSYGFHRWRIPRKGVRYESQPLEWELVGEPLLEDDEEEAFPESLECLDEAPATAPAMAAPKALSLEQMLEQVDAGFSETLLKLIDQSGKKDSEIYKKANLSKQHFSKIRNNPDYKPTKPTAIALALALELDLEQTRDLIGRAGYALTGSSKFDLIIRYFIEQRIYNVVQINIALYEFDQSLLGA